MKSKSEELREFISKNPLEYEKYDNYEEFYWDMADKFNLGYSVTKKVFLKWRKQLELSELRSPSPYVLTDKKVSEFDWREAIDMVQTVQKTRKKFSGSQDYAEIKIKADAPVNILILGDTQLGDKGVDYNLFKEITDFILDTPNLYVILVGDLLQWAVYMRGLAEVLTGSILTPEEQYRFLKQWIKEIKHKVLASTWCNHSSARSEKLIGFDVAGTILKDHTIFFPGIGHIDLWINDIMYPIAVSHHYKGRSMYNKTHGLTRYHREYANDRQLIFQGDYHDPAVSHYTYGGLERLAMVTGTIQTDSGYAKRYFTLKTFPYIGLVTLHHKEKEFMGFIDYKKWNMFQGVVEKPKKQSTITKTKTKFKGIEEKKEKIKK